LIGEGGAAQRRLAGLTWSGERNDRVAAREVDEVRLERALDHAFYDTAALG